MKEIFDTIENDLSIYGQENLAPKSLTIKDNKGFRHYELGTVYGVVCFNEGHVCFCDIKEDDENWYCFTGTDKQYSDADWIKTKIKLYERMWKWLEENMEKNYYSGFENKKGYECGFTNFKTKQ